MERDTYEPAYNPPIPEDSSLPLKVLEQMLIGSRFFPEIFLTQDRLLQSKHPGSHDAY